MEYCFKHAFTRFWHAMQVNKICVDYSV